MWKQYNQWVLHEDSQNLCAIWTPLGLLRPTQDQFGLKNMDIVAQGAVRVAREKHLLPKAKDQSMNAADDFTDFAPHTVVDSDVFDY